MFFPCFSFLLSKKSSLPNERSITLHWFFWTVKVGSAVCLAHWHIFDVWSMLWHKRFTPVPKPQPWILGLYVYFVDKYSCALFSFLGMWQPLLVCLYWRLLTFKWRSMNKPISHVFFTGSWSRILSYIRRVMYFLSCMRNISRLSGLQLSLLYPIYFFPTLLMLKTSFNESTMKAVQIFIIACVYCMYL